jgi:hypothetical protein
MIHQTEGGLPKAVVRWLMALLFPVGFGAGFAGCGAGQSVAGAQLCGSVLEMREF